MNAIASRLYNYAAVERMQEILSIYRIPQREVVAVKVSEIAEWFSDFETRRFWLYDFNDYYEVADLVEVGHHEDFYAFKVVYAGECSEKEFMFSTDYLYTEVEYYCE